MYLMPTISILLGKRTASLSEGRAPRIALGAVGNVGGLGLSCGLAEAEDLSLARGNCSEPRRCARVGSAKAMIKERGTHEEEEEL